MPHGERVKNLHIQKIYLGSQILPFHIENSFIDDSSFMISKNHINDNIINNSLIDINPTENFTEIDSMKYFHVYLDLGFSNNDVCSSELALFAPSKLDLPSTELYIRDSNFDNSTIKIFNYGFITYRHPIKFIFSGCNFNNTIIENLVSQYNIKLQFENCNFTNYSSKFEIEKIA